MIDSIRKKKFMRDIFKLGDLFAESRLLNLIITVINNES